MNPERLRANPMQWRELAPEARRMPAAPTEAEKILWQFLRNRLNGGHKFRRQHAIGPFVVDFYCVLSRLVVEVDGDIHNARLDADLERQAYLEGLGLRVLRVKNEDVLKNLGRVLAEIQEAAAT